MESPSSMTLNRAVIISALLHIAVFLIAWFGVPQLFHTDTPETPLVVEVLPLGEITNAPSRPEPPQAQAPQPQPPKPEPPKPEPPKPQPPKPPPPAPPPPPTPPPPAPPEPTPPPPKPAPPPPPPVPAPAPRAEAVPPPPPPPRPTPPKPAAPQFNLDSLLKDLTKRQPTPTTPSAAPTQAQTASRNQRTNYNPEMPLSVSEQDAIRQKIVSNWNVDLGAKDVETFVVELRIWVLPDGTVQSARIESTQRMDEPAYRSFAESAVRAALESSPLPLPADKADEITNGKLVLIFSAKDMLGLHG